MPRLNNNKNARPVRRFVRRPAAALSIALAAALALAACGKKDAAPAGAGGPPPAPQVGVVTVQPGDIGLVTELPGRLEASRIAEVRARAAGILQKRLFAEGSDVKAGQKLFLIDSAPYEAALAQAQASVAQAEASLAQSRALAERYRPLVAVNAISKQEYDNAVAAQKTAEANVAAAKAAVTTARINLGYATVTAPISGRIGRALVTEGALVNAQTDIMATIQQLDPVYVDFTQSSSELFALRRALAAGQLAMMSADEAAVRLIFDDGSEYAHPGKLLFSEASVDSSTGQITLRAEFPNPEGELLPGLYVRVRIEQAMRDNALTVPQMAVQRDQSGQAYVYALKDDETVERRDVTLGQTSDNRWLVEKGLAPGDRVVVAGAQKLYPDAKVVAQPVAAKPVPAGAAAVAEAPVEAPAETPVAPAKE